MTKRWPGLLGVLLIISVAAHAQNGNRIDTFNAKYGINFGVRIKKIDSRLYVGMLNQPRQIENNTYKKLIFGDSLNSVIALVRQTAEGLYYIPLIRYNDEGFYYVPDSAADAKDEKPLLLFNKKVNEKWEVNIDSSCLWQKEITFTGIQHTNNDDLYVYDLGTIKGNIALGDQVTRIYYSRKNGFMKLAIKGHWITVEVDRLK